jgi:glycosyltransferase involved in cell wall biosynthesis
LIRVLSITNNFPPIIDGVGDYTYHFHCQLIKDKEIGHLVICSNRTEIIDLVNSNSFCENIYPIIKSWNFNAVFSIIKFAIFKKINVIHLQYVNYSFNKYGLPFYLLILPIVCKLFGIKFTIFFHEVSIRITGHGFKNFILGFLQRTLAWLFCLLSFKVFVNTIWGKSLLWPFKHKIFVSPIPSNFENEIEQSIFFKNKSREIRIVSFLNRCNLNLLNSISFLQKNKYPKIILYLIGKADEFLKKYLIEQIEILNLNDVVIIFDYNEPETISNILVNSTIYIQLENVYNNFEGGISTKSGAVMAAMQSALPVISVKGDMTDLNFFKNLENIYFIADNSQSSITCGIDAILSDQELFESLGSNARKKYFQNNSFYLHSRNILQVFNTI